MTDQEYVDRLLELSTEFGKLVAGDERLASGIPLGAVVVFQVGHDVEFNRRAMAMAQERHHVVHIDGLAPAASRLINPHLEPASFS
jgi:hypothetical protein